MRARTHEPPSRAVPEGHPDPPAQELAAAEDGAQPATLFACDAADQAPAPRRPKPEPDTIAAIYAAYPRHEAKGAAYAAIAKALVRLRQDRGGEAAAWLLERVHRFAAAWRNVLDVEPDRKQYIPHPSTWFNQERYDDDELPERSRNKTNGKPTQAEQRKARSFETSWANFQ